MVFMNTLQQPQFLQEGVNSVNFAFGANTVLKPWPSTFNVNRITLPKSVLVSSKLQAMLIASLESLRLCP
ncbi:hypothetical protein FOPG_18655 [Fusarium oxysporum f. sp. conglutinans race 2 54008]|uniref:Uncharacterized protein n=1 Tax=Fusarium oxysporum f. sp. conglutinans race 2 54008 TaxID=1089457 RepID=X0GN82_FUSOX|nr:hypothetical protein FOPG_18655 [Fusarium oxysporum f. sp. conglutinans race 2 54008]